MKPIIKETVSSLSSKSTLCINVDEEINVYTFEEKALNKFVNTLIEKCANLADRKLILQLAN